MAGTYAIVNNTTLTDGNGGTGAAANLTDKYADSIINQNINADNEIFYQGLFAISTNTNRRANRESSLLVDTTSTGANTITDVAGYVLQMWVFIPFYTNHGVGFAATNWAGVQVVVADGGLSGNSNINTYRVDGNNVNVKGGWQLYVVDLRNTPTGQDSNLSVASLGSAGRAPRYVGWTHSTRGFALRRDPLAALDCVRFGRMQLNVTGGTNTNVLPSDPENSSAANFFQMSEYDDYNAGGTPANGSAVDGGYHKFGICEPSLESNGYILRGLWSIGTSSTSTYFEDYNSNISVRDEYLTYADFNRIEIRNASSTAKFINTTAGLVARNDNIASIYAPATPRGNFEVIDNATVVMDGCSWNDMGTFIFQSNGDLDDTTFRRCDQVTQGGASFVNCSFEATRADIALLSTVATASNIDSCNFTGDGTSHAVNYGNVTSANNPGTITWNSTFDSSTYATSNVNGTASTSGDSEVILVNVDGGETLTINVQTPTLPSYRNEGAGTVVLQQAFDLNVTGLLGNSEVRVYNNPSLFTGGGSSTEVTGVETVAATTETGDGTGVTTIYYNNTGVVNIVGAGGATFTDLGTLVSGDKVRVVVRDNSLNPTLQLFDEFTVGSGSTSTNIVTTETSTPATFAGIGSSLNTLTVTVEKVNATQTFSVSSGTYDVFVYRIGSLPIITKNFEVTENSRIPISQAGDRVYNNPA